MTGTDVKSAAEAAERLGVAVVTVQRWADDGQMPPIRKAPLIFDAAVVERRAAEMIIDLRAKLAHLTGDAEMAIPA